MSNAHLHNRYLELIDHQGFVVNGTGIPDVDFDVGESYAGYLPISEDPKDENKLFWWFYPSTNPAASKEVLIWLNGGVSKRLIIYDSHDNMTYR